jgi:hypothetical protein
MHRTDLLQPRALRPLALMLVLGIGIAPIHAATYTYHGDLMDGDAPAEGAYDLRVRSFANPDASKTLGEPTELPGVALTEGRFSVELDLPEDADGITWVEVAVRKAGSGDTFETLGDPQPVSKGSASCPGAWALDGNTGVPAGSFLGPVDADALLELRSNGRRVARFDSPVIPGVIEAPNVVFGASLNVAAGMGSTVSGGGATHDGDTTHPDLDPNRPNRAMGDFSTVGGGVGNVAQNDLSTVAGGSRNSATGVGSVVAGGSSNAADGSHGAIGGGRSNRASADDSTVGGGDSNIASADNSTVGGGDRNQAAGQSSTIAGGFFNCAGGDYSWAGGRDAKVRPGNGADDGTCAPDSGDADGDQGSFVWSDSSRALFTPFISTGPNQFAIRAAGGLRWEGTGVNSTRSPAFTHRVDTAPSGGNTCTGGSGVADSRTAINHPLLNGNPNAVILMTPNYGSTVDGVAPPRNPMGVYFNAAVDGNCAAGRWVIYDLTTSPDPLNQGAMFNIWFVLP